MKAVLTAKLKLLTTPEQFQALRQTQLAYRDALNYVSQYSFAHGKKSNQQWLQRECYDAIRVRFGLPAQMACNVPRQVGATYKGLWTKARKNAEQRKAGRTKKRYKGLDQAPHYVSPTLTYNFHRDYSLKGGQQVSILTLGGRVIVPYTGYHKHVALIERGAKIGAAKLWYDKPKKRFYVLISLEVEVADPTPQTHQRVIGVDVGQRYLAVVGRLDNGASFFAGKEVRAKADHYARLRKRLQTKGTRAATRRLVVIAGRERRLKQDRNHRISRRIVDRHPHSLIGLEDLTHIRERAKRKHGKKASKKQRKANRPKKGLLFECQNCHYTLHADLIGARNVALRTLLLRQDWMSTGVLSVRPGATSPDTSDREAKAARLLRYAELRWSPDASPAPSGLGSN